MTNRNVTTREQHAVQTAPAAHAEETYAPFVDISENRERIRLVADMPGADEKSVDVTVENNVLTIEGRAHCEAPQGYRLVGREYGVGRYRRDFTLSNAVSTEGIKARVRHGVLEITIPKRDEARTKKIEITN